uniref:Putative secreted protein n=1 Tax=Anopheles triannulatus TaxID=58253 RepID=A0A2M4B654_9DIPT
MQFNIIYFTFLNRLLPCVQCSMTQSAFLSQLVQTVTTTMRRRWGAVRECMCVYVWRLVAVGRYSIAE